MKFYFLTFSLIAFFCITGFSQQSDYKNPKLDLEKRVSNLLGKMTVDEKIYQLVSCFPEYKADGNGSFVLGQKFQDLLKNGVGSIQYINSPLEAKEDAILLNQSQKMAVENTRLGIPLIIAGEALHGLVGHKGTSFPQAIGLAASWDTEMINKIYTHVAMETRSRGTNLVFSPLLDISRDARWGRQEETYGEDTYLVSQIGLAAINGFQGKNAALTINNVVSSPKHFAGYAQVEGGRNFAPTNITERQFREEILEPFRQVFTKAKCMGVMPSHSEIDGVPCHGSEELLTNILRQEWGFKGIVVSDWNDVVRLELVHHVTANKTESALMALKAGVNFDQPIGECYVLLKDGLKAKPEYMKYLDQRVAEVLRVKFMLGLFENPYVDANKADQIMRNPSNKTLTREMAEKVITLLKNDNNMLPLDKSKVKNIGLFGPHANEVILGGYSSANDEMVTIYDAMKTYLKDSGVSVQYAKGCAITEQISASQFENKLKGAKITTFPYEKEKQSIADAAQMAKSCDVAIVCVGDNYFTTRESTGAGPGNLGDRANLDLVGNQDALIRAIVETGTPVVVVLLHGRALSINYAATNAKAILDGWYLGEQTGNAVVRTLFGENNPGGKLPVTVPRSAGQIPIHYSRRISGKFKDYLFEDSTPLFWFGYGLSYTQFEMKNLTLSNQTIKAGESCIVAVDLTNTGKVAGDQVVQVYVKDLVGSVSRPDMQLKAFKRVTLKPGETQNVKLTLDSEAFEMIDINYKRVIEPGDFKIFVGTSSRPEDLKELKLVVK
jgi:beta-glucosidase